MIKFVGVSSNSTATAQLANIGTVMARNGLQGDDEFDMFAQSRKATYEKSKTEYVTIYMY